MSIRPRIEADDAFIFSGWLKSFRGSDASGPYPPPLYFATARETITRIMARPGVAVLVCATSDPASDLLYGYVAHEPAWQRWSKRKRCVEQYHVVHYLYVAEQARGEGVARALLNAANVRRDSATTAYSFDTPSARGLLGAAARFIPDSARYESRSQSKE